MAHEPGHKKRGTRLKNLVKHSLKIINPGQDASNTYSKSDLERLRGIRKKNDNKTNKNKLTNPNPKQKELDKLKTNIKKLKGANKDLMQKKINQLEKYGKSKTWQNPVGAEGGGKPSSVDHSKNKTKTKKGMSSIEKKNRDRLGDARVDKLKAKQVDFKKMRKGNMSKADFIKKYPKSITAQKAKGLR